MAQSFSKTFATCFNERWLVTKRWKRIQIALRQVSAFLGATVHRATGTDWHLRLARRLLRNKQCRHSASQESFKPDNFRDLLNGNIACFRAGLPVALWTVAPQERQILAFLEAY